MFRIRRFGVIRTANVAAFLYVVLIAVIFVPVAVLVALVAPNNGSGSLGVVAILLVGLLIAGFYGVIGWVFTAIACLLYNFAAGVVGGIEVQLEAVPPPTPAPVWGAPPAAPAGPPPPAGTPAG